MARGTHATATGGVAGDISDALGQVEDDGFGPTGIVTSVRFRQFLRNARDANGQPLSDAGVSSIYGLPIVYAMNGQWPTGANAPELFVGDWTQFILGIREDITFKLFTEGVIQDPNTGDILYNLMQQDMVAMRVTFRVAWQVLNPVTASNPNEATRYPAAVVRAPAS